MNKIYFCALSAWAFMLVPHISFAVSSITVTSPYKERFDNTSVIQESGDMNSSSSGYWWVNSGAYATFEGGRGKTVQGDLPLSSPWRSLYNNNNALDTDGGLHPQNIFRFVGRSQWENFSQQAYFKINKNQLSASPNRNQSNGLLLFNRYKDSNNLYYTGIRVDGTVVIKKKKNGTYYTLAQKKIISGTYDRISSPNLLTLGKWYGLKTNIKTLSNGAVSIDVYTDQNWTGSWTLVASVIDDGIKYGSPISGAGFGGIRTDFMDVEFDQYQMTTI